MLMLVIGSTYCLEKKDTKQKQNKNKYKKERKKKRNKQTETTFFSFSTDTDFDISGFKRLCFRLHKYLLIYLTA